MRPEPIVATSQPVSLSGNKAKLIRGALLFAFALSLVPFLVVAIKKLNKKPADKGKS
jgi:hypothetical protein